MQSSPACDHDSNGRPSGAWSRNRLVAVSGMYVVMLIGAICALLGIPRPAPQPLPPAVPPPAASGQLEPNELAARAPEQTPPPPPDRAFKYAVRIEGHDIAGDAAHVLKLLHEAGQLPTREMRLASSEGVCELFIREIRFPGQCVAGLKNLAGALNAPAATIERRAAGSPVNVPIGVTFARESYFEKYDPDNFFDRERLRDHLKRRAPYVVGQAVTRTGMTRVEYAAFRLELERPTELPANLAQTLARSRRNIYLTRVNPAVARSTRFYAAGTEWDEFFNRWCQKVTGTEEFPYARLLGLKQEVDAPCGPEENCPNIVLIDTDLYNNSEIAASFPEGYRPAPAEHLGDPALRCLAAMDNAKHHGTFLAGLIASARNKIGFSGVHASALLYPRKWDNLNAQAIADALIEWDQGQTTRKQVYVFAGNWEPESTYYTGLYLHDEKHRTSPPMAGALQAMDGFWIVAAGQDTGPNGRPLAIERRLKYGPVNLGDERNVLVVTGCDKCGRDATLWPKANYAAAHDPRMVHVAAPATDIPGIANHDQYVKSDGTSPATALVAGLASAIVAKHGSHFRRPQVMKQWLQYTATPSLVGAQAGMIATGIVNGEMAMRDPTRHWLDTTEPGWNGMRQVEIAGWCQEAFTMGTFTAGRFTPLPHYPYVNVRNLFRLVRDVRSEAKTTRWFVYSRYPDLEGARYPGEVLRIGPSAIAEAGRSFLKLKSGVVRIDQIEDFLVGRTANPAPIVSCQ